MMSLQEIRDYVRSHLDLELEDLPDPVLDVFIREGSRKVESSEQRWPFYEAFGTLVTTPAIDGVSLESIVPNLKRVAALTGEQGNLRWLGPEEAEERFGQASSGRPTHYTEWANFLFLYPVPDAAYTFSVRGYRSQADWTADGAGAVPDAPEVLHNTIALWALSRAYGQQEDLEMAAMYRSLFDQELNEFGRRLTEMPLHRPLIMNDSRRRWRNRPPFDWEVS